MKYLYCIFMSVCPLLSAFGYAISPPDSTNWTDKGFDFIIAGGMFWGNPYNAAYYSGNPSNECNLNYLFGNKYWYDEINLGIKERHPQVDDSVYLKEFPKNVTYKTSMSISLAAKYKFDKHWGLCLHYTFSRLKTSTPFFIYFNALPSETTQFEEFLVSREDRSMIDLSVSYLMHPHKIFKPFIEIGVQFNYTRVKSFEAYIDDKPWNLLDIYDGAYYIPNVQLDTYKPLYGGAGYGVVFATGIKIAFNKYISIDPTFYLSASSIHLEGYRKVALNYGAQIRIVISDVIFGKITTQK